MKQEDYYRIIGVEPDASQEEIKGSYRKKALELHPDRNRDPDAAERMSRVNEAYAVLSDPEKRRDYDIMRQRFGASAEDRFRDSYSREDIFRGSDIHDVFEELSRMFGIRGFEDLFDGDHSPLYRSFNYRGPGVSARGFVFTTTPGAGRARGGRSFVTGSLGRVLAGGLRRKLGIAVPERGKDLKDRVVISSELARKGGRIQYRCKPAYKELLVTIPPGMTGGGRLRLKGLGEPGKDGGEPGDLYVTVKVRSNAMQWLKDLMGAIIGRSGRAVRPGR